MTAKKACSFAEFLDAANRVNEGHHRKPESADVEAAAGLRVSSQRLASDAPRKPRLSSTRKPKEKVGLTIDPDLVEAVDDYIYKMRKQGVRLKKNDVYEAALRSFLQPES